MAIEPSDSPDARFRIDRCLGQGGFGVVYLAHDLKRGAPVALKRLTNMSPGNLFRFKQEFRRLAQIQHENLVRLHELLGQNDQWFFTMEFVDGQHFLHYVASGVTGGDPGSDTRSGSGSGPAMFADAPTNALPVAAVPPARLAYHHDRLRGALREMAAGLRVLHDNGIVHCDLKPSNVLVSHAGRVVILDFGVAREVGDDGLAESVRISGTPAYMSPEQITGQSLTASSDTYAIGLMLFQVLAGGLPFHGSLLEIMRQKAEWQPLAGDFPSDAPADLVALCRAMLDRDPARRPDDAQLAEQFRDARPPSVTDRLAPRLRESIFVGREHQLVTLDDALARVRARTTSAVLLHGTSGIGKTTLAHEFLQRVRSTEPDAVVLRARCYEQESVPYKGLDGFIDAVVKYLRGLPPIEPGVPREMHRCMFPVMDEITSPLAALRRRCRNR